MNRENLDEKLLIRYPVITEGKICWELENLFALQDKNYREFHARLMPNIEKERIIGIRVPVLRKDAKELGHGLSLIHIYP